MAREYGKNMDTAYIPDSFGMSKDMVQIFNGFNLKNIFFRRGFSLEKSKSREFKIMSDQGVESDVFVIAEGYAQGLSLINNDIESFIKDVKKVERFTNMDSLFIMFGNDQTPVEFDLKDKINKFNKENKEYEIIVLEDLNK
jgi:mannosylglycerate hydrolase